MTPDKLRFKPLTAAKAAQDRYGFPIAATVAGLAVFGSLTAHGWSAYSEAGERFEVAKRDPSVKKQGGVDNNYYNLMTQRRQFMEAPRRQDVLSNKTMDIIKGIGVLPQVQIIEIKMPAPSISASHAVGLSSAPTNPNLVDVNRAPDVWMKISVPKSQGAAIYQAREVIRALISSTGMSIRTASQGWTEENGRRVFMLEGFIHA